MRNDDKMLKKVCIKCFLENKTQNQIANELYISRSKVSRLLTEAKKKNLVEFKFNFSISEKEEYIKIENKE